MFRGVQLMLLVLLFWAILASAQTNNAPKPSAAQIAAAERAAFKASLASSQALSFGLDRVEWLQPSLFGRPLWQYVAFFIYILLAFYLSKFLDLFVNAQFKRWSAKMRTRLAELLLELVHGPIKVISFVILLHVGLRVFFWPEWVESLLSKGLKLVVAASLTYMAMKCVDLLIGYWKERATGVPDHALDEQLFPILSKSFKVFVAVVALLVTSQNLGLDITSVLASLSIGGLAVGLAAQDTLANLFGTVAILIDKPFRIGDRIKFDMVDGVVETIGLRSTRVRNQDGYLVTIPNKTMGNTAITNISRRPNIKTEMNFGLTYETPPAKVKQAVAILEEVYRSHPKTFDLLVSFNKFGDSSLNILVVHWWNSIDNKEYLAGMQDLNLRIKERFDEARIEFAFPTETHYLKPPPAA